MKQQYKLKKGQSIFEVNLINGIITAAKYKRLNSIDKVLIERKDCVYLPALNKNHAQVIFNKITNKVLTDET